MSVIAAPPCPLELGLLAHVEPSEPAPVPPVELALLQPASSPAATSARKIFFAMITAFVNLLGNLHSRLVRQLMGITPLFGRFQNPSVSFIDPAS